MQEDSAPLANRGFSAVFQIVNDATILLVTARLAGFHSMHNITSCNLPRTNKNSLVDELIYHGFDVLMVIIS